jgi:D-alanyl-D-alanine carboxypeptidase (penicillin-binding protein 5/6)
MDMLYKGIVRHILVLLLLMLPCSVFASGITADSYILVEMDTFSVIAGKDYHRSLPPASTTKVLTTVLALEKLNEEQSIVPTRQVLSIPASKLSLVPGRTYKAMDLFKGTMVESANAAAYSLSVAIAGSEGQFAEMMNAKAREIGAQESHFENASGLSAPGHAASAYDLALIFRHALQNKRFQEIVGMKYFYFSRGDADMRYMNHNRLLFCFAPSIGGKTGFTRASRHCYVGAFEKEGKTYILAILGSRNLWADAVDILQRIYPDVPTRQELARAKACPVILASYAPQAERKVRVASRTKKAKRAKVASVKSKKERKVHLACYEKKAKNPVSRKKPVTARKGKLNVRSARSQ